MNGQCRRSSTCASTCAPNALRYMTLGTLEANSTYVRLPQSRTSNPRPWDMLGFWKSRCEQNGHVRELIAWLVRGMPTCASNAHWDTPGPSRAKWTCFLMNSCGGIDMGATRMPGTPYLDISRSSTHEQITSRRETFTFNFMQPTHKYFLNPDELQCNKWTFSLCFHALV